MKLVNTETKKIGKPNQIKTAVCCFILKDILEAKFRDGRFAELLYSQIMQMVYKNYYPGEAYTPVYASKLVPYFVLHK